MDDYDKFHTVRGYQLLGQDKNHLTPGMEDYLEMIYRYSLTENYIRINILSELLNVAAPSASKMVQKLSRLGLIEYKPYGIILLTENGVKIGRFLFERHNIIQTFLQNIGVDESLLLTETELIEHNVSASTLREIEILNSFMVANPDFLNKLSEYKNTIK